MPIPYRPHFSEWLHCSPTSCSLPFPSPSLVLSLIPFITLIPHPHSLPRPSLSPRPSPSPLPLSPHPSLSPLTPHPHPSPSDLALQFLKDLTLQARAWAVLICQIVAPGCIIGVAGIMQFVTNYLLITNNVTIPGSGALPLPQGEKQVEPGSIICSHLPCSTCVAMVLVINGE